MCGVGGVAWASITVRVIHSQTHIPNTSRTHSKQDSSTPRTHNERTPDSEPTRITLASLRSMQVDAVPRPAVPAPSLTHARWVRGKVRLLRSALPLNFAAHQHKSTHYTPSRPRSQALSRPAPSCSCAPRRPVPGHFDDAGRPASTQTVLLASFTLASRGRTASLGNGHALPLGGIEYGLRHGHARRRWWCVGRRRRARWRPRRRGAAGEGWFPL